MSTLPGIPRQNLIFSSPTSEIVDNLPASSPESAQTANLHSPETHIISQPQRSTTVRRKKPSGPNPFLESESKNDLKPELDNFPDHQLPFWKFHILRFGLDLYLTTNPTLRHLHCRNAPGYFVNITRNAAGYSMVFEDIETGEPLVKVEKIFDRRSDYFHYEVKMQREIRGSSVIEKKGSGIAIGAKGYTDNNKVSSNAQWDEGQKDIYLGNLLREAIPQRLLPIAPLLPMSNYASMMIDGQNWRVGSLPRYRESRINSHETKYVAKRNVCFHRCFDNLEHYFEWDIPPALAVYRECESASKKRALRQFNRLLRAGSQSALKQTPAVQEEVSPFTEISRYYKSGDGVYFDKIPTDDEPDHHHKLGWLTVYDDPKVFSHHGMFDLVVALTVAIGYERNLTFGDSDRVH